MQVAPLKHAASTQSSIFTLQSAPVQPLTQMQEYPPCELVQVAPFWQIAGLEHSCNINTNKKINDVFSHLVAHSSTSISQKFPLKLDVHLQRYELTPSIHVPPFWHKCPGQLSTFSSQFLPWNPTKEFILI